MLNNKRCVGSSFVLRTSAFSLKKATALVIVIAVLTMVAHWNAAASAQEPHEWSGISYPDLPIQFASGSASPSIRIAEGKGLRFTLSFSWADGDAKKEGFSRPNGDMIKLALHYPNGSVIEPTESTFKGELLAMIGGFGHSSGSFHCIFPWSENEMLESWLEVTLPDRSYWLEIPYGFTRDPKSDELPTARDGSPRLPAALDPFPADARIVNWKQVSYDLGQIQNGWRLSLYHSNPFDAHSEIVLYRDDSKIGKSMFLWDLHTPKTKLSIKHANGFVLTSRSTSLRLHDDGMRRSDTFDFSRNPGDDELRDWGTITIEVDDKKWATTMPSSLFRYVHGAADPYHKSALR